ncbi:MAG: SgcJ/EcaC family oxidoreductase [Gemmatimonadota bacterium]|jgi:uncharacterized protein (TIGR02246 family)
MLCKKKWICIVFSLFLVGVFACSEPPSPDTSEADLQAIRAITDNFDVAVNADDYRALAELYDDDAVRMPNEAPPQIGKDAIREWFRLEGEQYLREIDNVVRDVQVFGDWGYMWGDTSGLLTPMNGGEPITVDSKWMSVVRRQPDGSWKVYRDIYNSNSPPTISEGSES